MKYLWDIIYNTQNGKWNLLFYGKEEDNGSVKISGIPLNLDFKTKEQAQDYAKIKSAEWDKLVVVPIERLVIESTVKKLPPPAPVELPPVVEEPPAGPPEGVKP